MSSKQDISDDLPHIGVRPLVLEDYADLKEAMDLSYKGTKVKTWTRREIERLLKLFPEGQLVVEVEDKAVAFALAVIVDYGKYGDRHTYEQITGNYTFSTHDEEGDVLYGIDVFVHPDYRGQRLARRLYEARQELCESLNLKSIIIGGRIPNFFKYHGKLTPRQYIEQVQLKKIYDPILTFQLSNDFKVKKLLRRYLAEDDQSRTYATLLEWNNIYYEDKQVLFNQPKREIRIGVVQWMMRPTHSLEDLFHQAEFFIDTVSDYRGDFILFPEYFNAPLLARFNDLNQAQSMRELAGLTESIIEKFKEFAVHYNINIIAGSMPLVRDDDLLNVSSFCGRDGSTALVEKLHITPNEKEAYGLVGGDEIKVIDTDCGKIGINICYDVEFPEIARIQREMGMEILFVPFMTDLQTGYQRVRFCSRARAIENECYVAISGSVGNLPGIENLDIQYAQSAVFSPCDFPFPQEGIVAETTPNTEMLLLGDVNLDHLKELKQMGSVRNFQDRRLDLYRIRTL